MRASFPVLCLVCAFGAIALSAQSPGAGAGTLIRRFPYPFTHMVAMASDVDTQAPWHGAAIHRVINEQIGLPLSDSLWVLGGSQGASSLFVADDELNGRPSRVGTHTTFGLLLRQWHRGNVDTFHSWQDDSIPPLQEPLRAAVRLTAATTTIRVMAPPVELTSLDYRHLRLHFSAAPPEDLWLRLHGKGRVVVVSVAHMRAGRAVTVDRTRPPYIVEIVLGVAPDQGPPEPFNLAHLEQVELHAFSCAKGCPVAVTRLERDGFSRRSVLLQLPTLEAFNLRPAAVTSHGGFSYAQNFDAENFVATIPRTPGSAYESRLVSNVLRNLGNDPQAHAYHTDLLRQFGVTTLWSFAKSSKHLWNEPRPPMKARISGFHDMVRTWVDYKATTLAEFRRELPALEPALKGVPLDDIFCAKVCWGDQGSVLGLLVALSLSRIDAGRDVDHLWYTHFGSGDSDFERTPSAPMRASAVAWLERLANRMFNFDGRVQARHRVWVAPVGTIARYRVAHSQIAPHVTVDPMTSRVSIAPWTDPVTGKTLPEVAAGMRDLHGLTVYVPNSTAASVVIAGRDTVSFTRNPPDDSGRGSVTLVDDSTPTTILDEVPLSAGGVVHVNGGSWREPNRPLPGPARGQTFGRLAANGGDAIVRWQPWHLFLWNTSHLEVSIRRSSGAATPTGRFFLELEMADGGVISAMQDATPHERVARAVWNIDGQVTAPRWSTTVLSAAQLTWAAPAAGRRPPLPIGRVREIRFGLRGAARGEQIDVDSIRALRPNSNNVAPDGRKLIGGQVLAAGKPAPHVTVEAARPDGSRLTTVSDRNGYYFFFRQRANEILQVAALVRGKRCAPLAGKVIHLTRDEPELDIDLGQCR